MNEDKIEQQITEKVKNKITGKESDLSDKKIRDVIQEELIASKYIEPNDWHMDYAIERIYLLVKHDVLYKAGVVKDKKEITVEKADKKAKNALSSAWVSILILIWGSLTLGPVFVTPILFALGGFIFINAFANKSLNNNTSIPETALKAKKIGKILLIIGGSISLIKILVAIS